ncbi:hypothetical protein G9P44_004854 [Scheffersomyces stipitis]|nr:hypothetical protein G9P44_004854 [Scheffersomyces stipitis]
MGLLKDVMENAIVELCLGGGMTRGCEFHGYRKLTKIFETANQYAECIRRPQAANLSASSRIDN